MCENLIKFQMNSLETESGRDVHLNNEIINILKSLHHMWENYEENTDIIIFLLEISLKISRNWGFKKARKLSRRKTFLRRKNISSMNEILNMYLSLIDFLWRMSQVKLMNWVIGWCHLKTPTPKFIDLV